MSIIVFLAAIIVAPLVGAIVMRIFFGLPWIVGAILGGTLFIVFSCGEIFLR